MSYFVSMPEDIFNAAHEFFFRNELEQGVFLFGNEVDEQDGRGIVVANSYLVPAEGWDVQTSVHLEMKDSERAKIMKLARDGGFAVVDCHSHPGSAGRVSFSPSDYYGISEFSAYVRWKLEGLPYVAMVWGETSVDAVRWGESFDSAELVDRLRIEGTPPRVIVPRNTWFSNPTRRQPTTLTRPL